ncbi:MAG: alpha/beta hydrolase [Flavobacteriaceae bacterium]|nr:alpha/beta hydrolase [Flavobacteriaceae bacterium]
MQPVVIWVHGGAWAIGDKLNKMSNKTPFFRSLDYVFVSVNYRLSPFPYELTNNSRIKHPDHIIDVADAIQWVYENIELYGGDKTNIAVLGHSAGAHLVALMGTDQTLLSSRNISTDHIKAIGSFDTQAYDVSRAIMTLTESDLYINAFGDDETVQNDASPYYQVDNSSSITAHWLFTERGSQERKEILNDFILKAETKNVTTTKIDANGYTHADINNLIGDTSNTLMSDAIESFLNDSFQ